MAEFCYDCHDEMFGDAKHNDFVKLCDEDHCIPVLCEGCGPIYVDRKGRKLDFTKLASNYNGKDE